MNCVAQHAIGVKKGPHDFAILKWLRGEKTHLFSICCKRSLRIYVCASLLDPVEMNAILLPKHIESGYYSLSLARPSHATVNDSGGRASNPNATLPYAHDDARVFAHFPSLRNRVAAAQTALRFLIVNYEAEQGLQETERNVRGEDACMSK